MADSTGTTGRYGNTGSDMGHRQGRKGMSGPSVGAGAGRGGCHMTVQYNMYSQGQCHEWD